MITLITIGENYDDADLKSDTDMSCHGSCTYGYLRNQFLCFFQEYTEFP